MNKINAYCINLDRYPEKYEKTLDNFGDILEIRRFPAIDGRINNIQGTVALINTNLMIFNQILNSEEINNPFLIIIEDDIYKHTHFDYYWFKILEFINNKNNNWDFISLDFLLNFEKPKLEIFNDFLYKIDKSRMTGFMIYNTIFIKKNINYLLNCGTLDMSMKHNSDFIQLIPKELIVKQECNKISETSYIYTNYYEDCYNDTIQYLQDNINNLY